MDILKVGYPQGGVGYHWTATSCEEDVREGGGDDKMGLIGVNNREPLPRPQILSANCISSVSHAQKKTSN